MNLREMRKRCGITQTELAKRLQLQQNTITQWELGHRMPRADLLPKIADEVGCTLDELLRTDAPKKENPA